MKNLLCGVILLFALSGCSTFNPFIEQKKPVIKKDEFSDSIEILGVSALKKDGADMSSALKMSLNPQNPKNKSITSINYFIKSLVNSKNDSISHYIYLEHVNLGKNRLKINRASLKSGSDLDVEEVESDVLSCQLTGICTFYEAVNIHTPTNLLFNNIDSGISVKVYSTRHSFVINLSPEQISEQFKAIKTL